MKKIAVILALAMVASAKNNPSRFEYLEHEDLEGHHQYESKFTVTYRDRVTGNEIVCFTGASSNESCLLTGRNLGTK
jgi:hypothetical protein